MPENVAYPVSSTLVTTIRDDPTSSLPSEIFLTAIRKTWTHVPNTPEEAIALYRYVIKSQIEPAIAGLLKECSANLTEPEQAHVAANVKEVDVVAKKRWC